MEFELQNLSLTGYCLDHFCIPYVILFTKNSALETNRNQGDGLKASQCLDKRHLFIYEELSLIYFAPVTKIRVRFTHVETLTAFNVMEIGACTSLRR